jgi:mRNA N6-methyladenine demethylase
MGKKRKAPSLAPKPVASTNWRGLQHKCKQTTPFETSSPDARVAAPGTHFDGRRKKQKARKKTKADVLPVAQSTGGASPKALTTTTEATLQPGNQKTGKKKKKKKKSGSQPRDAPTTPANVNQFSTIRRASTPGKRGSGLASLPNRPPRPYCARDKSVKFFTPSHPEYEMCVHQSYRGFVHAGERPLSDDLHGKVYRALEYMREDGTIFHHDVVAAGKSAVSGTMCKRTLLGDSGMTYHYQKLRIFAIPWDLSAPKGDGSSAMQKRRKMRKAFSTIRTMNKAMDKYAKQFAKGSTEYNVALINFMPDRGSPDGGTFPLREEPSYGMGKMSVSWHADSSLQDFSTIGVYHVTGSSRDDWVIASRVTNDSQSPAVAVPLRRRDSYFMLDDFNHHHQHAVLSGSSWRYSSTHRVALVKKDTWEYIRQRAEEAGKEAMQISEGLRRCESSGNLRDGVHIMDPAVLRRLATVGDEVEFEWLRMFFLQGETHARSHHEYWLPNIEKLEQFWCLINRGIYACVQFLRNHLSPNIVPQKRTLQILHWLLNEALMKRREYETRVQSYAYTVLEKGWQPIPNRPVDASTDGLGMPHNLSNDVELVQHLLTKKMYVG